MPTTFAQTAPMKYTILLKKENTVGPPNNGHSGGKHFVHYPEVVPSSEVLPLGIYHDYQCKPHKL